MSLITAANCQQQCDTIARAISDINTALVTNTSSNSPTISTVLSGLGGTSPSLIARVLALGDSSQELILLPTAAATTTAVATALTNATNLATYYPYFYAHCNGLDQLTGGLANFLFLNSIIVSGYFSACFNAFAASSVTNGYRSASNPVTPIPATSAFIPAAQLISTYLPTGSVWSNIGVVNASLYGAAPLFVSPSAGATDPSTMLITYQYNATGGTTQVTFTPAASSTALQSVGGVSVLQIVAITVTSSGNNDGSVLYSFYAEPSRTVTY